MAKSKEQLCPACHALLDKYNRTKQVVNGTKVFLCQGCAEAAQKGKEAFRQRIEMAQEIRKIFKQQEKEQKEAEPPDPFEQQLNGMLEDMRKAEEFFKKIR